MAQVLHSISAVLASYGVRLPHYTAPLLLLVAALVFGPGLMRNIQIKQARRQLSLSLVAPPAERAAHEDAALQKVWAQPLGLVVVAEEALKHGRRGLAERALARLEQTGEERGHLRRLRASLNPTPTAHSVEAEVAAISRLLDEGQVGQAHRQMVAARERWPEAGELVPLQERLTQLRNEA
jgi:hypothetical protein